MALRKLTTALALMAGLGLAVGGAVAHDMKGPMPKTAAGKAAYMRHENFKQQGAAFKAINDELKKPAPDMAVITPAAVKLKTLSGNLPSWFPKGSGAESKVETDAKAEIWSDAAGFSAAANRFQVETSKLAMVATAGDLAGVKAQARPVGGACKNCHDKFRVPEKKS